ncbi:MAG: hypothetical protein GC168_18390 [Candidatus Hydrogenedens sp.]|nr:hypothetical protein [Candidatus Hydrogenedens sp.]
MIPHLGPDDTYEDTLNPSARWTGRLLRPLAWRLRGAMGMSRNVLVELRWRLGDEIMARPVVEALIAQSPHDCVWLWTHYPELFADLIPSERLNSMPSAVHRYLYLRSGPRQGYRPEHYARLAGVPLPVSPPAIPAGGLSAALGRRLSQTSRPRIALAPGASWPSKRWPRASWEDLNQALQAQGLSTLVLGQGGEGVNGAGLNLVGETSPADAAGILAQCDAAVTCDSGLMHLALAVGIPVVGLFGPTDPEFLVRSPLLHPVSNGLPCAGFWNRADSVPPPGVCACGRETCLEPISPALVLETVARALSSGLDRQ